MITASALALSGCSLALLLKGKVIAQQAVAGAVTVIAVSALLGYLYGADLTKPWGTTEISAYTVALLGVLSVGLLVTRSEAGFMGALLGDTSGGLDGPLAAAGCGCRIARARCGAAGRPARGALQCARWGRHHGAGITGRTGRDRIGHRDPAQRIRKRALASARTASRESDRRLRRALEHLLHVQENERRGLATDLHDDALPALSGIGIQLELARGSSDNDTVRERLGDAEAELRATRIRLRHLMLDLIPDALEREGVGSALRHRLEQMEQLNGIEYELFDRLGRQPSAAAGAVLYRIALEALRNVTRHADAKLVRVELQQTDGRVDVVIADDGVGFRPSASRPGHLGLSIMAARAELAGGASGSTHDPEQAPSSPAGFPPAWSRRSTPADKPYSKSPMRIARATAAARSETSSLS